MFEHGTATTRHFLLSCCLLPYSNLVVQLVQGAEAKALYGLVLNYKPLQALVDRLIEDSTLTGEQVGQVLEGAGLRYFPDPFVDGFTWSQEGGLVYPGMPEQASFHLIF